MGQKQHLKHLKQQVPQMHFPSGLGPKPVSISGSTNRHIC